MVHHPTIISEVVDKGMLMSPIFVLASPVKCADSGHEHYFVCPPIHTLIYIHTLYNPGLRVALNGRALALTNHTSTKSKSVLLK